MQQFIFSKFLGNQMLYAAITLQAAGVQGHDLFIFPLVFLNTIQ